MINDIDSLLQNSGLDTFLTEVNKELDGIPTQDILDYLIFGFSILIAYGLGLFAFSNILYPFIFTMPKIRRLKRQKRLLKPIPVTSYLAPPFYWSILVAFIAQYLFNNPTDDIIFYALGTAVGIIQVIVQYPQKKREMELDFRQVWKGHFID